MELPKNITQIGESDCHCKIYVEDYVISYMKQLNQVAEDKEMAVALYGVRREENGVSYLFLYGAGKLNFLQKETRHLSQAQQQEIEKLREKYFRDYTFLGYRLLNGEMIEGFHVCEQGICRYISGYAQFYEKNDSMLAYMLDAREEKAPEVVEQEKYDVVKKRQEERRSQHEEHRYQKASSAVKSEKSSANSVMDGGSKGSLRGGSNSLRGMRVAVVAVFALLCVIGLTSMNGEGKLNELQAVARQVIDEAMEQRLPDAEDEGAVAVDTLIAEDKLAEAVLKENETSPSVEGVEAVSAPGVTAPSAETQETTPTAEAQESTPVAGQTTPPEPTQSSESPQPSETTPVTENTTPGSTSTAETEAGQQAGTATVEEPAVEEAAAQPVSYTIKEGDTLIAISVRNYGNDAKVSEICSLNQIDNPDDIKVGQKILLP